jgi:hypothetical protein
MKKLAFFLALFVGLNASAVARKPEEEENQAIVAEDTARHSTAAWIQRIAHKLKACYYGITKDGFIHELGWDIIHKLKRNHLINTQNPGLLTDTNNIFDKNRKGKLIWIQYIHEIENGKDCCEINHYIKKDGEWECIAN